MSFTRHVGKRKSTRKRDFPVASEGNETEDLEYDSTKNSIFDIENDLHELRQKLKSVKKGAKQRRPYNLQQIQKHVQTKIHPHVGDLNSSLSTPFKEVRELHNSLQRIGTLEDELRSSRNDKNKIEQRLSDREKDLTTLRQQKEEDEMRLKSDIDGLRQQIQEQDKSNERLQGELKTLNVQLQDKDENLTGLKLELQGFKQQLQDRTNAIESLQSQQEDYKAKTEESEKRAEQLETAKRNVEVEHSQLQQKYNDELQKRENEINRLKGDLHKLHENYKVYIQQKEAEMQSWQTEAERRQNTIQTLINQREEERQAKEEERKQKDEALTRLSAIAGDRLRNNNPGITDLSDPNRPMKIAEKFTEMYDNDWTDSMEALEELGLPEDQGVEMLLHFLTDSYEECGRIVEELDCHLESAVMVAGSDDGSDQPGSNRPNQALPAEITKPIKDLRRKLTDNSIETLQKKITQHLKEKRNLSDDHLSACKKFVDDCIKYAWMMQIQDPPVYIEWEFQHASKIDINVLRSYTKAGTLVDFIVWPVLYLHKDGPVLNKGVVQPMQQPIPATEL